DLIAGDRRLDLLDYFLEQRDGEIGDADGAGAAFFLQLHQRLEYHRQVHVLRWPMHQIEIDMVELQLVQAGVEGAADGIGCEIFVPDLGGDVQLVARNAGRGDRRA